VITFVVAEDGDGELCLFARGLPSSHGLDIAVVRRCDMPVFWRLEMWDELVRAVLAGQVANCAHVWMSVRLDQTQACALCGTVRRHFCAFGCLFVHEVGE
jgi:hypothetical protein